MADEVTEDQINQYAESVGYRRISRREFELVEGDAGPHGTRQPLGAMRQRAQEYFDLIEEESGEVHEPQETTAEQLIRFYREFWKSWPDEEHSIQPIGYDRMSAILAGVAQGLVSQQGLILKEKELHSE